MQITTRRRVGMLIAAAGFLTAIFTLLQASYFPTREPDMAVAYTESGGIQTEEEANSGSLAGRPQDETGDENPRSPSARAIGEEPARLIIPKIGTDAHVQHVGVTSRGNMAVPSNFTDVGWYRLGPKPGERGSSVIAGHQDDAISLDGVFKKLEKLSIGDSVYVVQGDGERLEFEVVNMEIHPYNLSGPELGEIFGKQDGTYLNLITCAGSWLPEARTNDKRLVVYTKLVGS